MIIKVLIFITIFIFILISLYFVSKNQKATNDINDINGINSINGINGINGPNSVISANGINGANSVISANGSNGKNNSLQPSKATPLPGYVQGTTPSLQDILITQGAGLVIGMAAEELAQKALTKAVQETAQETAERLAKEAAEKAAKEAAEKLAKETAEKLAKETAEKIAKRKSQIKKAIQQLGLQLNDPKIAKKIYQSVSETGSAIKQLIKAIPTKGYKALSLAFNVGQSGVDTVAKNIEADNLKAIKEADNLVKNTDEAIEVAETLLKNANDVKAAAEIAEKLTYLKKVSAAAKSAAQGAKAAAVAVRTSITSTLIAMGPVGIAFEVGMLLFDVINAIVDAEDPNGYNLLDKWKEGSNQAKAMVSEIIGEINATSTTGKEIKYPSRVGPLEILGMMPKNCVESSKPFELPICPPRNITKLKKEDDVEDDDNEYNYLFDVLIPSEIDKIFKFDQDEKTLTPINYDPFIQPLLDELFNPIYNKLNEEEWNAKEDEIYKFFKEKNKETIMNKTFTSICERYGGAMDQDGVCMFKKDYCVNQLPSPPDPNCKLIPDPDADKCNNPPGPEKFVCEGGNLYSAGPYDISKGWSEVTQQCLNVNPAIKTICESNNLEYNVDQGMCLITEDMCRSKAGTPKKLEDGTIDCTIPMGQMITEAILGKTLTSVLVQTLATDQYEECKPGYIDAGKDGMMKNLNDLCKDPKKLMPTHRIIGEEIGNATGGNAKLGGDIAAGAGVAAFVVSNPMTAAAAAAACTVAGISSYFCRKECGPGETDVAGVCWINNPKLNDPPCDQGYKFDGVTTCTANNVPSALTLPIPNKCPAGYQLQGLGPLCVARHCRDGDKDNGLICQQKCKEGYKENGAGLCVNNNVQPSIQRPREKCAINYKFDGATTCWMDPSAATRGPGISPTECGDNANLVGITCWSKCDKDEVDKGATCESCPSDMINNGATTCYKKCDDGYEYDGSFRCNTKPLTIGPGVKVDQCPSDYKYDGVSTCWGKCPSGEIDKGATCESCDNDWINNGASTCYEKCDSGYTYDGTFGCNFNPETLPLGTIPNICPEGYNFFGTKCYSKTCNAGYKYNNQMSCERVDKMIGTGTPVNVTCPTGYTKVGLDCYENCQANYTFNGVTTCWANAAPSDGGVVPNYTCPDGYNLTGVTCQKKTTTATPDCGTCNGLSNIVTTGLTCSGWDTCKSGSSNYCDGGGVCQSKTDCRWDRGLLKCSTNWCHSKSADWCRNTCIGGAVTRNCNQSCPSNYSLVPGTTICKYNSNRPDTINADASCLSNRDLINGMCYLKCPDGYSRDGLLCLPSRGASYIPKVIKGTYSCPSGKTKIDYLCYDTCDSGYKYNDPNLPVSCIPNDSSKGTIYTSNNKDPTCNNELDFVDGLCYKKCSPGNTRVKGIPTQCQGPKELYYETKNKTAKTNPKPSEAAKCKSELDNVDGLCYNKCPTKANGNTIDTFRVPGVPTNCQGSRGLNYETQHQPATVRGKKSYEAGCKSDREKKDSLCYLKCDDKYGECYRANPNAVTECMPKKGVSYLPNFADCPDGYTYDGGLMCVNSYVPKTYAKHTITADCTGNRDQIAGSCYDKCPKISDGKGGEIQLKHAEGVPTQCVPPRGVTYPALVLSYVPETYAKKRAVAMSTK